MAGSVPGYRAVAPVRPPHPKEKRSTPSEQSCMLDTPILVGLAGKPERLEHSNSSTVGESGERVSSSHLTSIALSATVLWDFRAIG